MIRYADKEDFEILMKYEHCISDSDLRSSIDANRILMLFCEGDFAGWLRYNLFWDNTPFMNMLYLLEKYRGRGHGSRLVSCWEEEMSKKNYKTVLTSTLSNEQAQFFYRKNGYIDCGSLLLPGEPLEIIFYKNLDNGGKF